MNQKERFEIDLSKAKVGDILIGRHGGIYEVISTDSGLSEYPLKLRVIFIDGQIRNDDYLEASRTLEGWTFTILYTDADDDIVEWIDMSYPDKTEIIKKVIRGVFLLGYTGHYEDEDEDNANLSYIFKRLSDEEKHFFLRYYNKWNCSDPTGGEFEDITYRGLCYMLAEQLPKI